MPGIAGIISESLIVNPASLIVKEMTNLMKHEDFYSLETYADENVALGITSFSNKLIFNEKRTLLGLISGEFFGEGVNSLLDLYEQEGMKFLFRIKGEFVLVIYDIKKGKLFIASDRYGFKPLYYTELSDEFIFASEIKAIIKYPKVKREIDSTGLAEYALFNYPLGERTLVKNVQRFPPGEVWEFDVGTSQRLTPTKRKYCEFSELLGGKLLSARDGLEQSGEVFRKVVMDLLKREDKIGLTLSAGYDSRAILSVCGEATSPLQVKALTFGERTDKEALIASKLAQIVPCEHLMQEFEQDFADGIMDFLYQTVWITDGLCNITHSGLLYVFKKQREFMNPCFAGFGGSEIIRGLQDTGLAFSLNSKDFLFSDTRQSVISNHQLGFFSPELLRNANDLRFTICDSRFTIHERALFFLLNEVIRKYYGANVALMNSQVPVRLPYIDHDFLKFILRTPFSILHTTSFSRNPLERLKGQRFSASVIKYNDARLLEVPTDRGYLPKWNLGSFGLPVIFWHQIRRRLAGAYCDTPLYRFMRLSVKHILEESQTLKRDYYNVAKIKEAVKRYPNWNLPEWRELSKVVTFELWLRSL
ncbi:hypothetical protein KAW50_00565 [candidate division WOR-3 bacterium]|nr:hypothetical protein [candidate division WOR-3 bacterium]